MGKNKTPDSYYTVTSIFRDEIKIKGSAFMGALLPAQRKAEAENIIEKICKEFYDATHNCFAYRIDENTFRYSDDGEPSGTAGKPILSMLDKYKRQKVAMVVTRYFGGTKLGTGGLIRAYSQCAEATIGKSKIIEKTIYQPLRVAYSFKLINKVHHLVHKFNARISEDASPHGMNATIEVQPSRIMQLKEELIAATAGKIKIF